MNLATFEARQGPGWRRLDDSLGRAGGRLERLGPDGALELGSLYRQAAADLAYARRRFPGDPVVARLEALVLRGRGAVYGQGRRRGSLRAFLLRGYWQRLAERPAALAIAWLLLLLPALAAALWSASDPGAALGLVPSELQAAADPPASGRDFGTAEGAAFSTQVLINNIQVTLTAFAGGILFGVGTVLALVFNGLVLGVVAGLAIDAGNGAAFLRLVSAHGPLELSCIVVGGAAGLRMGWALISPGPRRRGRALVEEARKAVEIALGTAPWLVLCGFAEGFLTGPELPLPVQVGIGVVLAGVFWGLVAWRGGRLHPGPRLGPQVGGDAGAGQPVGRRLDHDGARAADLRGGARPRAADVDGHGGAREIALVLRRGGRERLELRVGRAGDHDGVAAREHGHRLDQRARGGLLQEVAEDEHERALGALHAPERELVVGVDGPRLQVEQRAHHRGPLRAAGAQCGADLGVERDRAAAVPHLVGDERDRGERVQARVEHGRPHAARRGWQRGGGQAPGVDHDHHVSVLLDAVLVAHRAPEAGGGAPVDLADVVVGQVVAHQLELGPEAERAAGGDALVAEAALAHREREPARGQQIGEHGDLGGPPGRWCQAARPSGPVERVPTAGTSWRPRRRPSRLASSVPSPSRGSSASAGGTAWRTRTRDPPAASLRTVSATGTPRASTDGSSRRTPGARRTAAASTAAAATSAATANAARPSGTTSAASASAASRAAARGVGLIAARARRRARCERRRRA